VPQTTLNANELKAAVQTSQALATELYRFMKAYSDQTPPGCYLARGSQAIQVNKTNITESGIDAILKHLNEKRASASIGKRLQQGLLGPSEALATHEVTAEFLKKLRAYLKNPGSATGPTFECGSSEQLVLAHRFEKTAKDLKPFYKQSEGPGMFGGRTRRRMRKAGVRLFGLERKSPITTESNMKAPIDNRVYDKLVKYWVDGQEQPFLTTFVGGLSPEQLHQLEAASTTKSVERVDSWGNKTVVSPFQNLAWEMYGEYTRKLEEERRRKAEEELAANSKGGRKSRRKSSTRRR
jgi:hypothetical protein